MLFAKGKAISLTLAACGAAVVSFSVLLAQQPAGPKVSRPPAVAETTAVKPTEKANRPAKLDLTPESFPNLHALIRPHDDEWRHLQVHWLTDIVAARKQAAAEDKPIIVIHTGGAGYNEPLGIC